MAVAAHHLRERLLLGRLRLFDLELELRELLAQRRRHLPLEVRRFLVHLQLRLELGPFPLQLLEPLLLLLLERALLVGDELLERFLVVLARLLEVGLQLRVPLVEVGRHRFRQEEGGLGVGLDVREVPKDVVDVETLLEKLRYLRLGERLRLVGRPRRHLAPPQRLDEERLGLRVRLRPPELAEVGAAPHVQRAVAQHGDRVLRAAAEQPRRRRALAALGLESLAQLGLQLGALVAVAELPVRRRPPRVDEAVVPVEVSMAA